MDKTEAAEDMVSFTPFHLCRLTLLPDLCMYQKSLGRTGVANNARVTSYDYLQEQDFFKSTGPDRT